MISTLYCLIYDFLCICDDFLSFSVFFGLTKCDRPLSVIFFFVFDYFILIIKKFAQLLTFTKVFDIISVYNNICVQNPHLAEKRGIDDERFPRYF